MTSTLQEILRPLSTSEALAQRMARLEGRVYPRVTVRPDLLKALENYTFYQVKQLSKFWPETPIESALAMMVARMTSMLASLASAQSNLAFMITGYNRALSLCLGTAPDGNLLDLLLRAQFPGIGLARASVQTLQNLNTLTYCHLLSGVPAGASTDRNHTPPTERIDRLVRGLLYRSSWALVVLASPIDWSESDQLADALATAIEQGRLEFRRANTLAEANRQGELYVELLESELQRALIGRTQGNWFAHMFMLSDLPTAAALAIGALEADQPRPRPLRAVVCQPSFQPGGFSSADGSWVTSCDLATVVQFPLQEYPGYAVEVGARFDVSAPDLSEQGSVRLGWIQDLNIPTGQPFSLAIDRLVGHTLVCGTTDSGKTNTVFTLLKQFHDQHIPFLVIEPTKGEYRYLVDAFPGLRFFTLGTNEAPLQVNPLYVPEGVPIQMHLDYLLSLFAASFVLYAPMPYVLEMALYEVYQDKGWDLAANRCYRDSRRSERAYPTLSDIYLKVGEVVDRLGYNDKLSADIKAALQTRINSLRIGNKGYMLDTRAPMDMNALLAQAVVVEMNAIGDDEQKAFLIGLLLMRLYEHYLAIKVQVGKTRLRHVTIIEEAHRLLQNVSQAQSADFANPRGKAVQTFCNIIAEIRAYGEGLVVVEQSPSKLAADVVKNTNLKLAHRTISGDDREVLGQSMNLDERQQQALVSLPQGRVIVFTSGMDRSTLVVVREIKTELIKPNTITGINASEVKVGSESIPVFPWRLWEDWHVRLEYARWILLTVFGADTGLLIDDKSNERLRMAVRASVHIPLRSKAIDQQVLGDCFSHLGDDLASGLGAFYSWNYTDELAFAQEMINLWPSGKPTSHLRTQLTRETEVVVRPFAGCTCCPTPCRMRYFAHILLKSPSRLRETVDLLEAYNRGVGTKPVEALNLHARLLADVLVDRSLAEIASTLGLCALVLASQEMDWPDKTRSRMTAEVWPLLCAVKGI